MPNKKTTSKESGKRKDVLQNTSPSSSSSNKDVTLFRDGIDVMEDILQKEVIPFYDRNPEAEEAIYQFVTSTPPQSKAKIMTLFEPTGTGKTTILSNIPIIYDNVYSITITVDVILSSLSKRRTDVKIAWFNIFAMTNQTISHLSKENKSVLSVNTEHQDSIVNWNELS